MSVKHEPHGTVSGYLTTQLGPGAILDAAAPRGDFLLDEGTGPVLLISAGIGLTPVLSMLHELAARDSDREIWWIHGARRPREHPLAAETHALLTSRRTPTSTSSTAQPHPKNAAAPVPPTGGSPRTSWSRCPSRPTRPPTSADPPPSWPTCSTPSPRPASTRPASTPSSVGAMPSINPGLTGQRPGRPTSPRGRPGPARW
ncbi:hypothetical protein [Streptomyces mirabilis]